MRNTIFNLLFASTLGLGFHTQVSADQHALLIGISDYQHADVIDLEGPVHDISAMHSILLNKWGLSENRITTLVNEQATERNIRAAFQSLLDNTKPGDDIMLYFSGHGTSVEDKHFGAILNLPDGSGALVAYDFDPAQHRKRIKANVEAGDEIDGLLIGRYEIKQLLKQLNKDRTVFVIFDSCFSGNAATRSLNRGFIPTQKRLLNISLGTEFEPPVQVGSTGASRCMSCDNDSAPESTFDYENVIYFGAAKDTQEAIDISKANIEAGMQTIDGKPHGGFTDALLRQMSNPSLIVNESLSYRKLFNLTDSTFRHYCSNCGHDPVLLPIVDSKALSKTVLSKNLITDGVSSDSTITIAANTLTTVEGSEIELQIATADLPKPVTKALKYIKSVELDATRPDIELLRSATNIEARYSDGQLITTFPADTDPSQMTQWLGAQSWLKARKLKDTENNQGTIRAIFGNPLTNPVAFAGNLAIFTLSLDIDAKLVMLVMNSKGEMSLLFPINEHESRLTFKAEKSFKFPNQKEIEIRVEEPWGTDNVVFYALPTHSTLDSELLALASKQIFSHDEPLLTRFTDALDSGKTPYGAAHVRFHSTN